MRQLFSIIISVFLSSHNFAQQKAAYYHYEGKLGPRDAVMEIAVRPPANTSVETEIEPISAYYFFKDDGIPMLLYKSKDKVGKNTVFRTWSDDVQERFEISYDDKALVGRWFWSEKDEGEPIKFVAKKLTENESFTFQNHHKVIQEELNQSDALLQGTVSFSAFLPSNKKLQDSFISFATGGEYKDFKQYSNAEITTFVKSYKDEMKQFLESGDAEYSETMNHFAVYNIFPVLNSEEYLIMSQTTYSYYGGAHGMNTELYYNYSKKSKKWLSFYDIFDQKKEDEIQKIIEKELRRQYKIPANVKLSEAKGGDFLVDEIPFNDNFTISKHHITFYYQPYEITPYAFGVFKLQVPFENFKNVLKN